jgi:hypothetical protein
MASLTRRETHDENGPVGVAIRTEAPGISIGFTGWYKVPGGSWVEFGSGKDRQAVIGGGYRYDLPTLPNGSLVRVSFGAIGREKGDAFHVDYELSQNDRVLDSPDPHYREDLLLGDDGVLNWVWTYEVI